MADAIIQQGHLTQAEFDANPSLVLEDGQIVWLTSDSGKFKKGDGVTALSALPFLGNQTLAQVLANGNSTGEQNIVSNNGKSIASIIDSSVNIGRIDGDLELNVTLGSEVGIGYYNANTSKNGGLAITETSATITHSTEVNITSPLFKKNGVDIATTSDLPTLTSQLTNDGANGTNPFITALDLPNFEGLKSGGTITVVGNDIQVSAASWVVGTTYYNTSTTTTFASIALSSSGLQRYIGLYGTTSNTITKVEGSEAALATYPTTPANTIVIGYVLVNDASASTTPDLSGYLLKLDKATQATNTTGTDDTTYVTPLANAIKENTANKSSSYTASSTTTYANTKALVDGLALKQNAIGYVTADTGAQTYFYSDIFLAPLTENHAITADGLRGNPFIVRKQSTLDSLAIRVSSPATAGTNGRFAIYTNVNQNKLGVKLWEGSNFSTNLTGTVVVTAIGLSLAPGIYWAVFNSSATSGLLRTSTGATRNDILGSQVGVSSPLSINGIAYSAISFGSAFPSDLTATSPSGYLTGANCPAIFQGYL